MTLQQLKYIVCIAKCGSISEAARSLFIAQPLSLIHIYSLFKGQTHFPAFRLRQISLGCNAALILFLIVGDVILGGSGVKISVFRHPVHCHHIFFHDNIRNVNVDVYKRQG